MHTLESLCAVEAKCFPVRLPVRHRWEVGKTQEGKSMRQLHSPPRFQVISLRRIWVPTAVLIYATNSLMVQDLEKGFS